MEDELFDVEDVLFHEHNEQGSLRKSGNDSSSEDEGDSSGPTFSGTKLKAGVDITGASSTSHQSSTLHASLEDEMGHSVPTASPPMEIPAMLSRRAAAPVAGSMHPPRHGGPQVARLGTSAPIAIPNMMNRWRVDSKSGNGQQADAASTFIPPHQLSKQDDFMFSFTGASPSATLKRERLRTRNAILRSTGFLEPQAGAMAVPIPALELSTDNIARTPVQSSLTAALTTIGEA